MQTPLAAKSILALQTPRATARTSDCFALTPHEKSLPNAKPTLFSIVVGVEAFFTFRMLFITLCKPTDRKVLVVLVVVGWRLA